MWWNSCVFFPVFPPRSFLLMSVCSLLADVYIGTVGAMLSVNVDEWWYGHTTSCSWGWGTCFPNRSLFKSCFKAEEVELQPNIWNLKLLSTIKSIQMQEQCQNNPTRGIITDRKSTTTVLHCHSPTVYFTSWKYCSRMGFFFNLSCSQLASHNKYEQSGKHILTRTHADTGEVVWHGQVL